MKHILKSIFVLIALIIVASVTSMAQVSVNGTNYSNLASAFSAISGGNFSGNIEVKINDDITETTVPTLLASGYSGASYSSLVIYPTKNVVVRGSLDAIMYFKGCDNIVIDGRINKTGPNGLTIINDSAAAVSCVRFDSVNTSEGAGCVGNIIRNVNFYGASKASNYGIVFGVVSQTIATSYPAGMNNNQILNNTFKKLNVGFRVFGPNGGTQNVAWKPTNILIDGNIFGSVNFDETIQSRGIYVLYSKDIKITNNIFQSFNDNNTGGTGAIQSDSVYSITISNNKFFDFYSVSFLEPIYINKSPNSKINNNIFKNLTGQSSVVAITLTNSPNSIISSNTILNLTTLTASAANVVGLKISGINDTLVNNVISKLVSNNVSNTNQYNNPFGIQLTGGNNIKIWYNSINMCGDFSPIGVLGSLSSCIGITSTSVNTLDIKNNVFVNTTSNTFPDSRSLIYYLAGTGNLTNSTFSNNCYYYSGSNKYLAWNGTALVNTLSDWKTLATADANSIFVDPQYNGDLNLKPSFSSPILGAALSISDVVYDVMGSIRGALPSIGAYQLAADDAGPKFTYNKLKNTYSTLNRTINVNIFDYAGVNSSSSAPRIYYRKQTAVNTFYDNTNTTDGWKFVTGNRNGDDYSFTIDYSKLPGEMVVGDVIEYFVCAVDNYNPTNFSISSGFLGMNPITTNLSTIDFPVYGTIESYKIVTSASGNLVVGSGEQITNLTGTNGLFNYLNNSNINGDLNIIIKSDLIETGEVALLPLTEENGSNFKINIKPSDNNLKTISGSIKNGMIKFFGASNLTVDGSYNGNGRYLKFENSYSTLDISTAVFHINNGNLPYGGKNITIQNCYFKGGFNFTTSNSYQSYGILVGSGSVVAAAGSVEKMSDILIKNNIFNRFYKAINIQSGNIVSMANLVIDGNEFSGNTTSDQIGMTSILIYQVNGAIVKNNIIKNMKVNPNNAVTGIEIYGQTAAGHNCIVENNQIFDFSQNYTTVPAVYGIALTGGNGHIIRNNYIGNLSGGGRTSFGTLYGTYGIRIYSGTAHRVIGNTVVMNGTQNNLTTAPISVVSCLEVGSSSYKDLDVRNNNFYNFQNCGAGSFVYAIQVNATSSIPAVFAILNYNNYYVSGGTVVGTGNSSTTITNYTLDTWKTFSGKDANSQTQVTQFVDQNDFHLTGLSVGNPLLLVPSIPENPTDLDNETRNAMTYVGADELKYTFYVSKPTFFTPSQSVFCNGSNVTVQAEGTLSQFGDGIARSGFAPITYQWYKNGVLMSGSTLNYILLNNVSSVDSANYYTTVTFYDKVLNSSSKTLIVESPIQLLNSLSNADVCNTNPSLNFAINSIGTITGFQWQKQAVGSSVWTNLPGKTSSSFTLPLSNPQEADGKYRVAIYGPGNCGANTVYSNEASVNVTVPVSNIVESTNYETLTPTVCKGEDVLLSVTGQGTIYGYQWQKYNGTAFVDLLLGDYPTANTSNLSIPHAQANESGIYRCIFIGSSACNSQAVPSKNFNIKIWIPNAVADQPAQHIVCTDEMVVLETTVEGTVYSYQWQKDGKDISVAENASANKSIFIIEKAKPLNDGIYQCVINTEDCQGLHTLRTIKVPVYVVTNTEITVAPETQAAPIGGKAIFAVKAHVNGAPKDYTVKVQWYRGGTKLVESAKYTGTQSTILVVNNVSQEDMGKDYSVEVIGKCDKDMASGFGIVPAEIKFTKEPEAVSICEGENATFGVEVTSNNPTGTIEYQWYNGFLPVEDNARIQGSKTNTLTITGANITDAGTYYPKVKLAGSQYSTRCESADLEITKAPVISLQPESNLTVQAGKEFTLKVLVNGNNMTFQWYFNNTLIPGENNNIITRSFAKVEDAGTYKVVITNKCGETTSEESLVAVSTQTTDMKETEYLGFKLGVAVPNPVVNTSNINYTLPMNSNVNITLFDQLGNIVAKLVDTNTEMGNHNIILDANKLNLVSGTYYIVMNSANVSLRQSIIVIK